MTDDLSSTAREILAYLVENSEAQDTLEGIMQWWLFDRHLQSQLDTVRKALDELIAAGFVGVSERPGSGQLYRLTGSKPDELKSTGEMRSS